MLHTFLPALLVSAVAAQAPAAARAALNEEVPFITTPANVAEAMLEIAGVKPGDHVIDLGSGDGRIVIAAAKRGATGLGVDNDPKLVAESIANAKRAGVESRARFLEQDLFQTDLSGATVVTMYLLPEVNLQLRPAILALRPGTRIVSHDWDMGDWRPDRSVRLPVPDKSVGVEKSSRVHLWIVPAKVDGLWCGSSPGGRAALRLRQSYQGLRGAIHPEGKPVVRVSGKIAGSSLVLAPADGRIRGRLTLAAADDALRPAQTAGAFDPFRKFTWRRAAGEACPGR